MPAFHCEDCNNNDCGNCVICNDIDKPVDYYPDFEEDTIYDDD